jgi:membrane protease YdiL (CAAX protease family)
VTAGAPSVTRELAGRPPVPWRGRDAVGVALIAVALTFLAASVAPGLDLAVLFPIITALIGIASVGWASFYRRPGELLGDRFRLGLGALGMASIGWLVVFGLQILLGVLVVMLLGPDAAPDAGGLPLEVVEGPPWSLILTVVVVAPVAEELYFRGFLLQGLWRSFGPRWATFVSAVVFGLFHFSGARLQTVLPMVSATLIGLVFGYLFVRTRNLAVTVLAHALVNGMAVSLVLLLTDR